MNKIHVLCLIYQLKQRNPSNLPVGKLSIFSVTNILDIAINRIMDQVKLPMELIKWYLLNLTQTIYVYLCAYKISNFIQNTTSNLANVTVHTR